VIEGIAVLVGIDDRMCFNEIVELIELTVQFLKISGDTLENKFGQTMLIH